MPRKKKYVVRVVIPYEHNELPLAQQVDGSFLECLRYAGLITIHNSETGQLFDLQPPAGVTESCEWATANAARMCSFGYNAVCAPATE